MIAGATPVRPGLSGLAWHYLPDLKLQRDVSLSNQLVCPSIAAEYLRTMLSLFSPNLIDQSSSRILTTHAKPRPILDDDWPNRLGENGPDRALKHLAGMLSALGSFSSICSLSILAFYTWVPYEMVPFKKSMHFTRIDVIKRNFILQYRAISFLFFHLK